MENINLEKLKEIELEMLVAFKEICDRHGITYFLLGGTALGAVRHKGFIPWDDDIDVGLPRKEYDRFLEIAPKELPAHLFLQTIDSDPHYVSCFSKIRNSKTTFIETTVAHHDINHGVFIDVFPLDGCTDYALTMKKSKLLKARLSASYALSGRRSLKGKIATLMAKIKYPSVKTACKKLDALNRSEPYEECETVINYGGAWGKRELVPRTVFGEGSIGSFEGIEIRLPADVDAYLSTMYGDYMTPSPPEKRVGHHYCTVIDLEKSYIYYTERR